MSKLPIWDIFWAGAGRVPLRQKIMGIIVAPLLILGFTIAWWVSSQLGGWLSYLLSEERVAQAMAVGMRSVFIITIFAALAGLGIGSVLTWVLTRPILDMTYVARRVKGGDLSVRAPVWAKDEIGELGLAFNDMIASLDTSYRELERSNQELKNRNQELAVLYRLADMASKSFSMSQISEQGLQQALENTGASAGLILLLNGNGPTIGASQHLPTDFLTIARQSLPDFEFDHDHTDRNGGPLIIEDVNSAVFTPPMLALESRKLQFRTLVIAPISVQKGTLGILAMLYPDATSLSRQHRQLISGICNQLGVTIQNSQLWEELRRKEKLRARLLNKVVSAQEDERHRISRELHDETGQSLTSLLVQLKILEHCDTFDDIQTQIAGIREQTLQTLQEVRRLAADLRPAALDDLGLVSALEGYIHDYVNKTGLQLDFQTQMEDSRLPHDIEIVLYRVIQESLTNILRHAKAERIRVNIEQTHYLIRVMIADDGCGFDTIAVFSEKERGLGLLGMQERIELLGGRFALSSAVGQGTQIEVELALPTR